MPSIALNRSAQWVKWQFDPNHEQPQIIWIQRKSINLADFPVFHNASLAQSNVDWVTHEKLISRKKQESYNLSTMDEYETNKRMRSKRKSKQKIKPERKQLIVFQYSSTIQWKSISRRWDEFLAHNSLSTPYFWMLLNLTLRSKLFGAFSQINTYCVRIEISWDGFRWLSSNHITHAINTVFGFWCSMFIWVIKFNRLFCHIEP